ncbi:MAG: mechanosensitive ion channel family protein [Patescibacteria group bacterium]|nr:mechanosensitive ion channel family protein [Patescibacteria group bacterium]
MPTSFTLDQFYSIPFWNYMYWGNAVADYAIALVAFLLFLVLFKFIQLVALQQLKGFSKRTKTDIDDTLVEIVGSIKPPFYSFLALYFSFFFLEVHPFADKILNTFLLIWAVLQGIVAVQILINYAVHKKFFKPNGEEVDQSSISFLKMLLKVALWLVGSMLILSNLGVNITSLVAGLGIGGLAVALALQNILSDLFSSFAIHFDKPFVVGDFVIVGEHMGVVEKIGIKTTRIRALQGEEIVISNQELTSARIQNFRKLEERRISFDFGVLYETPTEKVKKIPELVKGAMEDMIGVRFDRSHFMRFDDSALVFSTVYYVESNDYLDYANAQQEINLKLLETFTKEGIVFAYPTRTIRLVK